jgi:hypothetical protein
MVKPDWRQRSKRDLPDGLPKFYGKCEATGKWRYADRKSAKKHVKYMSSQGGESAEGRQVYRCVHCEDFHAGHHFGLDRETHRQIALGDTIRHDSEAQN